MKKLINDPDRVAGETIEGLSLAFPQYLRQLGEWPCVMRCTSPQPGKVAIITGGGSGHEPMFAGFTGRGMADGSVAGNIFTSPPPPPIVELAKAVHGGAGILFIYGNYAGDVLNFDMASEILQDDKIPVETALVTDDVASAPPDRTAERRGIAGGLLVIKVAGAKAEEVGSDLAQVLAAARHANQNTRTMGVALSSCIIPASGRPIFDLGEDEMEIGMGIHGEPGVERGKLKTAEEVAANMVDRILADLSFRRGDEVAVLVNGLGATPLGELFIVFRSVSRLLRNAGLGICRAYVGNYVSSLEMAGCSVSIMRIDAELKRLLLAPTETPGLVQV